MNIICSPNRNSEQVGMYKVQLVEDNVYKATLTKYTGNKQDFPGTVLLRRQLDNWLSFPEGYRRIVDCLISELEKFLTGKK